MHISVAGKLGSGKSTICRKLKNRHGFQVYSTGAIQREMASQHKVSTLEMNNLMAKDLSFDHAIDDAVAKISIDKESETIIFDSRMAWKFATKSFKVFVTVDPLVAAERVMGSQRGEVEAYANLEEAKSKLIERARLENERFVEIYGVNNFDYSNYNLIIDSTYASSSELADIVYDKYRGYCKSNVETQDIVLTPTSLYPVAGVGGTEAQGSEEHISVALFDGYHFIVEGRQRVLEAIVSNEKFVEVKMADADKYPILKSAQNIISEIKSTGAAAARDFEKKGKFKYKSYPDCYFARP
ncbi:MAG: cytidylate kinase family protein [Oscillospiraceae bacterium]|nr:cytidylate kinase family protein [Oscillospiraceae bacterium]